MVNYISKLKEKTSEKLTENGAVTYDTTNSSVLDMFAQMGAMRAREENEIILMFDKAYTQDPVLTLKTLFYLRDIRDGQGERRVFRICIKHLAGIAYNHLSVVDLYHAVVEYGRYDDLYEFVGTPIEKDIFTILRKDFVDQVHYATHKEYTKLNLLGKWLKSENASSEETKRLALITRKYLQLNAKEYRKSLTLLRNALNIVESYMCAKDYAGINYAQVPSQAMLKYKDAFMRNDNSGYQEYLDAVKNKEAKINTSTLFPHQIVSKYAQSYNREDPTLEVAWKNLPNYCSSEDQNAIVVADVSGSMGSPLGKNNSSEQAVHVSQALAIYFAERARGPFKNHCITFSRIPKFFELKHDSLAKNLAEFNKLNFAENTDIEAVFLLLLNTALAHKIKQKDMINLIYLVSDMEFDMSAGDTRATTFSNIKKLYDNAGYKMPTVVFWNVSARQDNLPVKQHESGTVLVSGYSATTFKLAVENKTPYQFMLDTLNSERYSAVDDILKHGTTTRQKRK